MIDDYKKISNCCGAYIIGDRGEGLCSACKEGCVSVEREEEEERKEANEKAIANLNKLNKQIVGFYSTIRLRK